MAIPKSTMVMAALTCIPLGLAVRDYIKGDKAQPRHMDPYGGDAEIDTDELDEPEPPDPGEELARQEAREEEARGQRREAFRALLGSAPATLGSAFDAFKVGMTETMFDNHYDEASAAHRLARDNNLVLDLHASDGVLDTIAISADDRGDASEICEQLDEYLTGWTTPSTELGDDKVWQSPDGLRAERTSEQTCTLSFRQFVPADAWIKKTGSPFPLWAVGQSSTFLMKSIEPQRADLSNAPDAVSWTTVGVGAGTGAPELTAYLAAGKVLAVNATFRVDDDTAGAIAATLDKLLGKHAESEDGDVTLTWAKKPTAHLEMLSANTYSLTVGALPEE
jgi:hypothetical protein